MGSPWGHQGRPAVSQQRLREGGGVDELNTRICYNIFFRVETIKHVSLSKDEAISNRYWMAGLPGLITSLEANETQFRLNSNSQQVRNDEHSGS